MLMRLHGGEEAAFEAIFCQHYARIYRLLWRLVGSEADDLAQETFLRLYTRPPRRLRGSIEAWLIRVAVNLAYNRLRAMRRQKAYWEQLLYETDGRGWQPIELAPHQVVERTDICRRVRAVLARLKRRQAMILLLRYDGFSYREIAEIVGVVPGSVGTLLARAERAFEREARRLGLDLEVK